MCIIHTVTAEGQAHAGDAHLSLVLVHHRCGNGCYRGDGVMAQDDEIGMAWWNALTEQERAKWSRLAGTGRAKDAWELFKRRPDDALRDAHAALVKAIVELKALGVAVPVSLYLAAHALTYAHRGECQVLPFKPKAPQQ